MLWWVSNIFWMIYVVLKEYLYNLIDCVNRYNTCNQRNFSYERINNNSYKYMKEFFFYNRSKYLSCGRILFFIIDQNIGPRSTFRHNYSSE